MAILFRNENKVQWMLVNVTGLFGFRLGRTAELPIPGVNHTERRCVVAAHRRTQDVRCQTTRVHSLVRKLYGVLKF